MRINLTYFIQIINFLITYWFLNRFLFKPVILFIKNKKEKESKFNKRTEKKEHNLLDLEKKKHQDLVDFRVRMKKEYGIAPLKEIKVPSELTFKKDPKEIEELINVAKNILVKEVPHVD